MCKRTTVLWSMLWGGGKFPEKWDILTHRGERGKYYKYNQEREFLLNLCVLSGILNTENLKRQEINVKSILCCVFRSHLCKWIFFHCWDNDDVINFGMFVYPSRNLLLDSLNTHSFSFCAKLNSVKQFKICKYF